MQKVEGSSPFIRFHSNPFPGRGAGNGHECVRDEPRPGIV